MACRGHYTALLPEEAFTLLHLTGVDRRLEFLDSLFISAEADGRILLVDKSWDAMHRILCDGWLDAQHGDVARRACLIGGQQPSTRPDWIVSYVEPALVKTVVVAIEGISRDWFRTQYFSLNRIPPGFWVHRYEIELSELDFEYTWHYFREVRRFYAMAANRGFATVFLVDQ